MNEKILIIDDEENIRFSLERFLLAEGYEVATASNYNDAISKIDENKFDLIFSDIILKGKTGINLLEEVHKRNLRCPVVMFTGVPTVETASEAVRLGAFDYIAKPIRQATLLRVAGNALRHYAILQEREKYRQNLEAIFRSVKDAIITVDPQLLVIQINEAASDICGISTNTSINNTWGDLLQGCSGKCVEILKETILKNQSVEKFRLNCLHENRPSQVVSITASPLNQGEILSGAVMVIRDETRLAGLEQNLHERKLFHRIIGKSYVMQEIYNRIEALANVRTTVLLSGKSGTGKEMVADAIHFTGRRKSGPFVKVNCSALPENLLESELFGHTRGAFTGATMDKIGRFQRAEGGTILLDEIGDISNNIQLRLLRILQDMEFERVGDSTPIKADVRVIAATNKDLREEVKSGKFREDLYYRLKIMEITLPPLKERQEDIPLLTTHFIDKFNQRFNKEVISVSDDVMTIFMDYPWPGNIRELEHAMEHAFVLCRNDTILLEHLPDEFRGYASTYDNEYKDILKALEQSRWNRTEASRMLGMSRQSLYRKMRAYNLME